MVESPAVIFPAVVGCDEPITDGGGRVLAYRGTAKVKLVFRFGITAREE